MADTESIRQAAHMRVPFSAWFGIMLLFIVFGAIVLAVMGPSRRGTDFEKARVEKRLKALKTVQDEQKTLTNYAWADKTKGTVRIPIDRAMELTITELANRKPASAYPIVAASPTVSPPAATPAAASAHPPEPNGSPLLKGQQGNQSENGKQPAAAVTPAPAAPGTQPGPNATPAASSGPPSANPAVSPTGTPQLNPPGSPLPVRGIGKTLPSATPIR